MSENTSAPRGPRLSRRTTVLASTAAAALLAGTTRTTWIHASAPDLAGTAQQVTVTGSEAAPAVLALSLVAIAASLATALSSRWLRLLTGPVLIAAGAGSVLSALDALRAPEEASRSAVASATGVLGSTVQAETTTWPLVALLPALAVAAIGVLVLVIGRNWPVGTRYRSAAVIATADPGQDPAAAWDALTRGEDPSLDGTGEDAAADGVEQSAEEDPRTSR